MHDDHQTASYIYVLKVFFPESREFSPFCTAEGSITWNNVYKMKIHSLSSHDFVQLIMTLTGLSPVSTQNLLYTIT